MLRNVFANIFGQDRTPKAFEIWVKIIERGVFIVQERTQLVDIVEAVTIDEANKIAKGYGGYAVLKVD